ncbi:hypothetical protein D9757_015027 [Collybiopsis confluens]|uniref:Gfd2/YDR514C-like C-terminal domain-containing protein n=1 Tax=Collybiopsis confluens TaxID=2823264 RepID=A0A8H5CJI4_9AGAR|nr:hypothetical protein D9757_015027 [Collybiopsis confluens]
MFSANNVLYCWNPSLLSIVLTDKFLPCKKTNSQSQLQSTKDIHSGTTIEVALFSVKVHTSEHLFGLVIAHSHTGKCHLYSEQTPKTRFLISDEQIAMIQQKLFLHGPLNRGWMVTGTIFDQENSILVRKMSDIIRSKRSSRPNTTSLPSRRLKSIQQFAATIGNFICASTSWNNKLGTYLAIDFEWETFGKETKVTEFGWSRVSWRGSIQHEARGHIAILPETPSPTSRRYLYGVTTHMAHAEFCAEVVRVVSESAPKCGPLFLIMHASREDKRRLAEVGLDLSALTPHITPEPKSGFFEIDTQAMYRAISLDRYCNLSLKHLCTALGVNTVSLHNAGNDSYARNGFANAKLCKNVVDTKPDHPRPSQQPLTPSQAELDWILEHVTSENQPAGNIKHVVAVRTCSTSSTTTTTT